MNGTAAKLAAFAVLLVVVFAGATAIGAVAGPAVSPATTDQPGGGGEAGPTHDMDGPTTGGTDASDDHTDTGDDHAGSTGETATGGHDAAGFPGGLAVSQDGYTFAPETTEVEPGAEQDFRFVITGPDGLPVRDFTEEHDQQLHLILVRRDLSGFQHVHPERGADGTWSIPLTVREAGEYRAFADFVPAGGQGLTLGVDLRAAGNYAPRPAPLPSTTAEVDGYTVELTGDLTAGTASDLTLAVSRDGRPVTDLEPYLGTYGHLVALREGDLAYLHVHPRGGPGDGATPAGPVAFTADVPSPGTYRLYLDFQHGGTVRTAEFTVVAERAP